MVLLQNALRLHKVPDGRTQACASDLAVLQVSVDVLDESIVRVTDREDQLTQRTTPDVILLSFHPQLKSIKIYH